MTDDELDPEVTLKLRASVASEIASIALHLAALVDPTAHGGPRDAAGNRSPKLDTHRLSDAQFAMLRKPQYEASDRLHVAGDLRTISAAIEGQLPPEAPSIRH